jgi:hypothetical protein
MDSHSSAMDPTSIEDESQDPVRVGVPAHPTQTIAAKEHTWQHI